jgi:hypothetical protein
MSRHDGYADGVPSWIVGADPQGATFSVSRVVPA